MLCDLNRYFFNKSVHTKAHSFSHSLSWFRFPKGPQEVFLLPFADHICLISITHSNLQNQLNNLEQALDALKLAVNLNKTKVMVFFHKEGFLAQKIGTVKARKLKL